MKTKLRLLFTNDCNRRCKGCCNRNWTGEPPMELTIEEIKEYDEIYITGGEPMLYPVALKLLIKLIRTETNKIFLYTALPYPKADFMTIMNKLDGATVTLHSYKDRQKFIEAQYNQTTFGSKTMRLNAFVGKKMWMDDSSGWDFRPMKWIVDAPLPEGEVFAKLKQV